MKISPVWLIAEVQAWIKPPPITLVKREPDEFNNYDIINIKMRRNPSDASSEMYELKIVTFDHKQPEELLQLVKNFKREVDETGTTTESEKINYLLTLLRGEAGLMKYPVRTLEQTLPIWSSSRGFTQLFFSIKSLSKQKRFAACQTELNNYLPIFPVSSAAKKIPPEDINNILLHAVPNGWAKQAYLQGWEFDIKSYKAMCELFKRMEVAKKIYECGNTYKTPIRVDANRAIHDRKLKGGESALSTNPNTVRAGKRKTRNASHPGNRPTRGKSCLFHGPRHFTGSCKLLKYHSIKYAVHRTHN